MSSAHLELPYDRGHNWHLVAGAEKATISERAAFVLAGLAVDLAGTAHVIADDYRLSKKARKMLEAAGVKVE